MAFVRRLLEVSVSLAQSAGTNQAIDFDGKGSTVTLANLRSSARVQAAGAAAGSAAQVAVWGMTKSLMDQLSTMGIKYSIVERNTLTVRAGDSESGFAIVFAGTIINAYPDYNSSPDVAFRMECQSGLAESVIPGAASSYTGTTDVATIMENLAGQMGLVFENNGVNVKLASPYFAGSPKSQVDKVARDAGINYFFDPSGKLAIWPRLGSRSGDAPTISKENGMIGWPMYTAAGLEVRTRFNPNIIFGGTVKVVCPPLPRATGTWSVFKVDHELDSMVPRGSWKSTISVYNPNQPQPVPPPISGSTISQ